MKILLLGKDGQVGWELQRSLLTLGNIVAPAQDEVDFEHLDRLRECLRRHQPDIVVNAAAYTAVDKAESEPEKAQLVNAEAVAVLAQEANRMNAWLVHYSTDYVFDGQKPTPYAETDEPNPLSVYGRTKLEGENRIRACHEKHMIFRTSWVFAARGNNFAKTILRLAKNKETLSVIADQYGAPTSAELLADVTALALRRAVQDRQETDVSGTFHVVPTGETSWHGYAQYVLTLAQERGVTLKALPEAVHPIPTEAYPLPAARPRNSRLDVSKVTKIFDIYLPDWHDPVRRCLDELTAGGGV